jgi:hypothetical protein
MMNNMKAKILFLLFWIIFLSLSAFSYAQEEDIFCSDGICDSLIGESTETRPQDCGGKCTEVWTRTIWSECMNGQQTRTRTDQNNCGTELNKPAETRSYILAQADDAKLREEVLAAIWSARQEINKAREEGKNVSSAEEKLMEANRAFDQTDYTSAKDFANQALELAKTAPLIEEKREFSWMVLAGGVAIICIIMMIIFKRRQKTAPAEAVVEKKPAISEELLAQLLDYARKSLSAGYTPEQIKKLLLDAGWSKDVSDYVINKVVRERK